MKEMNEAFDKENKVVKTKILVTNHRLIAPGEGGI